MRCQDFLLHCQKCNHHFHMHERIRVCPECGEPRTPCGKGAVKGWKWCEDHGGPNPQHNFYGFGRGVTSGGGSHFPLVRLAEKYNRMQTDGRILSNRTSLEIVRQRIQQLAERIDLNEAPDRLARLYKLWEKFKEQELRGEKMDSIATKAELDAEFQAAGTDYAAWRQMFEALDLDRKMVESEMKVIKEMKALLTAEDAYELAAKLLAAIISTTNSLVDLAPESKSLFLKRIQYEFTRIVGDGFEQGPGRGSAEVVDSESGEMDGDGILHPGDEERPETEGETATPTLPEGRPDGGALEG